MSSKTRTASAAASSSAYIGAPSRSTRSSTAANGDGQGAARSAGQLASRGSDSKFDFGDDSHAHGADDEEDSALEGGESGQAAKTKATMTTKAEWIQPEQPADAYILRLPVELLTQIFFSRQLTDGMRHNTAAICRLFRQVIVPQLWKKVELTYAVDCYGDDFVLPDDATGSTYRLSRAPTLAVHVRHLKLGFCSLNLFNDDRGPGIPVAVADWGGEPYAGHDRYLDLDAEEAGWGRFIAKNSLGRSAHKVLLAEVARFPRLESLTLVREWTHELQRTRLHELRGVLPPSCKKLSLPWTLEEIGRVGAHKPVPPVQRWRPGHLPVAEEGTEGELTPEWEAFRAWVEASGIKLEVTPEVER